MKELNRDEFAEILAEASMTGALDTIIQWRVRGDGVAIYRNEALDHRDCGKLKILSYGSPEAWIEQEEPPVQLPDTKSDINWPYRLFAVWPPEAV